MKNKAYKVSDLFYTSWQHVSPRHLVDGYTAYSSLQAYEPGSVEYGKALIMTMRALRKNWRLVDQITVEQAVDIFNEIAPELSKPWYTFPQQRIAFRFQFIFAPKEKMGNRTFDHLVYADSCLMKVIANTDPQKQHAELSRLAAILYTGAGEQFYNDREVTAKQLHWQKNLEHWQLQAIFYTFVHIKKYIVDNCVHLFEQAKGAAGTGTARVTDSMPMWSEIKFILAESGVFGTFDEVGKTDLYKVINYLESKAKKQKEDAANAKSK
jgi:hypothetical protein